MPPMPVYYVGKGRQFGVLDMFDGTDRAVYDAALERLNRPLTELAADRAAKGGLSETDVRHFDKDWLGNDWWPNKHVELILRAGIRKALEVATAYDDKLLPVEALWVCADEDVFQVYVNEGPHQVTIIVYTPPPKRYAAREQELQELIWVVKTRDDFDDTLEGPIRHLNPQDEWPVLIERQLNYAVRTVAD